MRYLDAQDAAHLYSSCGLMKGALVDSNCREMHLIWWLLCQVENIVWRYNLVIARHAGALQGLLLGMYEDVVHWELENVAELQGLYRDYQEVVEWIPIHIEDRIRDVHDCGMVFQVLLDFDEGDVVADFSTGERPFFFHLLRTIVSYQLRVRTRQFFGTRHLWLPRHVAFGVRGICGSRD